MNPLLVSGNNKPRTGTVKVCPECGQDFYARPSQVDRRVYCSHPCKVKAQVKRVTSVCQECGKEFVFSPKQGRKHCSWVCYLKSREVRHECRVCGTPITKPKITYCSHACRAEGKRKHLTKPCESCGKIMPYEPHQASFKKYCSRACSDEGHRQKGIGYKTKRQDGYIAVYYPTHPDACKNGTILEHRLIAEQKYGRRILKTEHVHHLDGDKSNNDPSNLEVIAPGDHARISNQRGVAKRKSMTARLAEYEKRFGPLA